MCIISLTYPFTKILLWQYEEKWTYSCRALLCWDPAASLPGLPSTQLQSSQSASSATSCLAQMILYLAAVIAEHRHLIAIALLKDSLSTPAPAREHWPGRSWRCHGLKRRAKIGNMSMSGRHGSSASCAGARPLGAGGAPGEEQHEAQEEMILCSTSRRSRFFCSIAKREKIFPTNSR